MGLSDFYQRPLGTTFLVLRDEPLPVLLQLISLSQQVLLSLMSSMLVRGRYLVRYLRVSALVIIVSIRDSTNLSNDCIGQLSVI